MFDHDTLVYQENEEISSMNKERELLLDIKKQFGWPVDLKKYGLSSDNQYWNGRYLIDKLPEDIQKRVEISKEKLLDAQNLCQPLTRIKWIKGIFITGSVASLNARQLDDIDIWLVVESKRIWLVRALDFLIFTVLGRRRLASDGVSDAKVQNKFCFNMYTTEEGAKFKTHTPSFAIQLMDSIPIFMRDKNLDKRIISSNLWIRDFFPSWYALEMEGYGNVSDLKSSEDTLIKRFFNIFEYIAGVLMILKSQKKLVLSSNNVFRDMFTTWETPRILTIYDKKIVSKRSKEGE